MSNIKVVKVKDCDDILPDIPEEISLSLNPQNDYYIFPGFCDVHVHFREPGFFYKESIESGSKAAAHGGYTDVCTMPNLNPVPDCMDNLEIELDLIRNNAVINIHPYGAVTKSESGTKISEMSEIAESVIAFSDDGKCVPDSLMKDAMIEAKRLGKIIAAHCEDLSLVNGGCINECDFSIRNNLKGICNESEWKVIERDIKLAEETGCPYHVCHISCAESADLIRQAKADGIDITCETAPHYLLIDDSCLENDGRYKMNPPLRSRHDREALIEALSDGTIDMIATDHAPHSAEEKARGLEGSPFGISGIEIAFPVLYTGLVKREIISLEKLTELLTANPRRRFGIKYDGSYSVWNLNHEFIVDSSEFFSKGKSTPFDGTVQSGLCITTICGDKTAYKYSKAY